MHYFYTHVPVGYFPTKCVLNIKCCYNGHSDMEKKTISFILIYIYKLLVYCAREIDCLGHC